MGKKKRLKLERAAAKSSTEDHPPAPGGVAVAMIFLAVGYIFTSFAQMGTLLSYDQYRSLFQNDPEVFTRFRYLISWGARFMGLAVGFGFFFRKDFFRKAAIFLAWASIAGVFWKHPYEGFVRHIRLLSDQMIAKGTPFSPESVIQYAQAWNLTWFTESTFAWFCAATVMLCDVGLSLGIIFFLTRPSVRSNFR